MTEGAKREERTPSEPSKAYEVALELMKQLITLASGVLALSATFIERLQGISPYFWILLAASWLALLISVFFGLQTISAIVQSLRDPEEYDWSEGYGKTSAKISKYGFVVGISFFAVFAFLLLIYPGDDERSTPPAQINIMEKGDNKN